MTRKTLKIKDFLKQKWWRAVRREERNFYLMPKLADALASFNKLSNVFSILQTKHF